MRGSNRTWVVLSVAVGMLGLFLGEAFAGFTAMPLKADLDVAKTVVVGRITAITRTGADNDGKLVWGRAIVAVSEPLKGTAAKETTMIVVMRLDSESMRGMQSPPGVYRKGDEGIFVIGSDGRPSHGHGLLSNDRLKEVKAALDELDKRTWSKEVNGLKVWASADMGHAAAGAVVFAVKNVSKKPIYLPRSLYRNVVTGVAQDATGKEFPLRGIGDQTTADPPLTSQQPLQPGETRYMHPDGEDHGFFVIPRDLPAGKYTAKVTLRNDATDGHLHEKPVRFWTGKIVAPTFTVAVPKKPAASRPVEK